MEDKIVSKRLHHIIEGQIKEKGGIGGHGRTTYCEKPHPPQWNGEYLQGLDPA